LGNGNYKAQLLKPVISQTALSGHLSGFVLNFLLARRRTTQ